MLIEAFLVAIWAGICSLDDVGPQMLRRPLLTGTVAGIIMGDTVQGLAIAATLELMWLGIGNVGAARLPVRQTAAAGRRRKSLWGDGPNKEDFAAACRVHCCADRGGRAL